MEEKIETLDFDDDFEEVKDGFEEKQSSQNAVDPGKIIDVNRLFNINEDEEKIALEEIKKEEKKKDNKIFKIQIILLAFLVVSASLIYFFGYDLLKPYINID